jgi:hypothetical protein
MIGAYLPVRHHQQGSRGHDGTVRLSVSLHHADQQLLVICEQDAWQHHAAVIS